MVQVLHLITSWVILNTHHKIIYYSPCQAYTAHDSKIYHTEWHQATTLSPFREVKTYTIISGSNHLSINTNTNLSSMVKNRIQKSYVMGKDP